MGALILVCVALYLTNKISREQLEVSSAAITAVGLMLAKDYDKTGGTQ